MARHAGMLLHAGRVTGISRTKTCHHFRIGRSTIHAAWISTVAPVMLSHTPGSCPKGRRASVTAVECRRFPCLQWWPVGWLSARAPICVSGGSRAGRGRERATSRGAVRERV
jgi:hypothetical protein